MTKKQVEFKIMPLVNPSFDRETVAIDEIRELSTHSLDGCPPEDRAYAWLAMLGVYPQNPLMWPEIKKNLVEEYWSLVPEELKDWHTQHMPNQMSADLFNLPNKPLMAIIHGDIVRTGRTIFFLPPEPIPNAKPNPEDESIFQFGVHARRLERILYTFSTFHRGLGYMQGFNELLPPIYYVLINAKTIFDDDMRIVEALSFHCFQELLTKTEICDLYTTTDASSIILHKLNDFVNLLKKHLPNEAAIIEGLGIHPLLYCYRWFNLMFSQEHDLPSLLAIWDTLFAHFDQLVLFIYYVGIGHVKSVQSKIVKGDYGGTISALQYLEISDIKQVLEFANKCWNEDHKKKFELKDIGKFFNFSRK